MMQLVIISDAVGRSANDTVLVKQVIIVVSVSDAVSTIVSDAVSKWVSDTVNEFDKS